MQMENAKLFKYVTQIKDKKMNQMSWIEQGEIN